MSLSQATEEPDSLLSVKLLFGPHFTVDEKIDHLDPLLSDTRSFLDSLFGKHVSESDIESKQQLPKDEFERNAFFLDRDSLETYFGENGAKSLLEEPVESFRIVNATVPSSYELPQKGESWLVEMPKIYPNRQTVHADPQPFQKDCPYLLSGSRMLFTPSNVMRWAFSAAQDTFLSNSRVVRWSDGSMTLHIGEDVYSLNDWRSNAEVHLLGSETTVSSDNAQVPAFVANVPIQRHFVIDSSDAISIHKAVAEENTLNSAESKKRKLGYTTDVLPQINWDKPSKEKSLYEEFVANEYHRRGKIIEQRRKEGKPMSLSEQIQLEQEMNAVLRGAMEGTVDLEEKNKENTRDAFINERQRSRRSRLDRVLEEGPTDPFDNGDEEDDDEEQDVQNLLSSWEKKRNREEDESDERRNKQRKYDIAEEDKLKKALEDLSAVLPRTSEVLDSVDGMIELLETSVSPSVIEEELQTIIKTVRDTFPSLNISALESTVEEIFESR